MKGICRFSEDRFCTFFGTVGAIGHNACVAFIYNVRKYIILYVKYVSRVWRRPRRGVLVVKGRRRVLWESRCAL
jgi:hypothetical protein